MKAKILGRILMTSGVALMLALTLPLVAGGHTEEDPLCESLRAKFGGGGPAQEIGEVCVWNDSTNLYIRLEVESPYMLRQAMAKVAGKNEGKPGDWEYDQGGLSSDTHLFTIPLVDQGLVLDESTRIWVDGEICCSGEDKLPLDESFVPYIIQGETTSTSTPTSTTEPSTSTTAASTSTTQASTTSTTEPSTSTTAASTSTTQASTTTTTKPDDSSGGGGRRRFHDDDVTTTTVAAMVVTSTTAPAVSTTVAAATAVAAEDAEELPYTGADNLLLVLGYSLSFALVGSGLLLEARW